MFKFAPLAALFLFSVPVFADAVSAQSITLTASSGGGVNDLGLFDFAAWGNVNFPYVNQAYQGTTPTNLSFTWNQTFALPASPAGDYFEVSRVNTAGISATSSIVIDGEPFNGDDGLQAIDHDFIYPIPDPNLYKANPPFLLTERMALSGPIDIHVYGSFTRQYSIDNCCYQGEMGNLDGTSFEQFLQIERFHADGTPDPFAPEPASFGLVGLALLPVGWMIRRRSATRYGG